MKKANGKFGNVLKHQIFEVGNSRRTCKFQSGRKFIIRNDNRKLPKYREVYKYPDTGRSQVKLNNFKSTPRHLIIKLL
jgi:hypothetical protein